MGFEVGLIQGSFDINGWNSFHIFLLPLGATHSSGWGQTGNSNFRHHIFTVHCSEGERGLPSLSSRKMDIILF